MMIQIFPIPGKTSETAHTWQNLIRTLGEFQKYNVKQCLNRQDKF